MPLEEQSEKTGPAQHAERIEARTMVLYVSIVLLAEFAAIPEGRHRGPTGVDLVAILWGTTIGLTLAHWFAYEVASRGVDTAQAAVRDRRDLFAELAGAALVATAASVPVLLLPYDLARVMVPYVLALVIGTVAYMIERAHGRTRPRALLFAAAVLVVGLLVATIKDVLAFH